MATAKFTDVIEELQESNLIEGETLNTTLNLTTLFEDGFLFVGEMIEELKLSLSSMQPVTAAFITAAADDSAEAVAESNDDVVAAEEETQKVMKSGLALIAERLGGILTVFKKRDRDEAGDDLQEGEDAREAAKARLKDAAKKGGKKAIDFAKSTNLGRSIASIVDTLKKSYVAIVAAIGFFSKTIVPLLTGGKGLMGFMKTLKGFAGKVLLPLTAVVGAFKGISTFFDNKDLVGGMEAFRMGFTEFVGTIAGWIIDLPLWLLEKIAGLLGADKYEKIFADLSFDKLFKGLLDGLGNVGEWIGNAIYKLFAPSEIAARLKAPFEMMGDLAGKINDGLKSLVASMLPDPTGGWMSASGIAAKAIPASIYKWAGIDKKTGEKFVVPEEASEVGGDDKQNTFAKSQSKAATMSEDEKEDEIKRWNKLKKEGVKSGRLDENQQRTYDLKLAGLGDQDAIARLKESSSVNTSSSNIKNASNTSSNIKNASSHSNKTVADLMSLGYSKAAAEKTAFVQQGGMSQTVTKRPSTQQSNLAQAYVDDTAQRRMSEDKQTNVVPVSNVSDNSTTNSNMTVVNNNAFPQQSQVHDY